MKTKFISAAVLAVAALSSVGASAQTFNTYLFDQMKAPATRTRADVKAEAAQAPRDTASTTLGVTGQQNLRAAQGDSNSNASQAAFVKTSQK